MAQYIDKSAVVAKIKGLIRANQKVGAYSVLNDLLHFLDTIEVKEVKEVDLEKEIDLRIGKLHTPLHYEELKDFAKHFYELGLKAKEK